MFSLPCLRGSVWDMDGCVYRFPPKIMDVCDAFAAATVRRLAVNISVPDDDSALVAIARESYRDVGCSLYRLCEQFEIPYDEARAVYHNMFDHAHITPEPELPDIFNRAVNAGHRLHLATHSHIDYAERLLRRLGLEQFFVRGTNIHTLDEFGHERRKSVSAEMVVRSAERMGLDPHETAFVEDSSANLVPAKDHGFSTVLIHWGRAPETKPSHIDAMFATPAAAMRAIARP